MFTIRSTVPVAQKWPYVSVIGEERVLRIAELTPRDPWSYFQIYVNPTKPALLQGDPTKLNL